ncbi:AzlC family ABC transporter permease [Georgenia sp. 10Sc9-8]|uniref:AzlC family ABC transporter permease n=1 Tax=Georgenia halotolerans TaxID=3028317 RepID=A0ABT5U2A0_9MICO|nr:AzlC family ABC transporter permease [Georgenia halotolerans]
MTGTASTRADVVAAVRDSAGVGMGYIPLGAAFGVLLVTSGLDWWWAPVFSVLIYAGSMEFLAIGLVTGGAGLVTVATTTFFVNFRHVFYGLSFPLHLVRQPLARLYGVHALTDEAYALVATRAASGVTMTGPRVLTTEVLCHLFWLTGSTVGALAGAGLGLDVEGLGFALTALFVVLTIDALRATPDPTTLATALGCAVLALVLTPDSMLVLALGAFALLLVARFAVGTRRAGTGPSGTEASDTGPSSTGSSRTGASVTGGRVPFPGDGSGGLGQDSTEEGADRD